MKKIIKKICYLIYLAGKNYAEQIQKTSYNHYQATIGINTLIESDAIIQNSVNDKSKIIIGDNCHIRGYLLVMKHGGSITIGNYSHVGPQTKIWSAASIKIGNRVLISYNVNIHDNISHPLDSLERHKDFVHIRTIGFQDNINLSEKEIVIEDDVWIGFNSTILKGVTIGKGAIIGANTLILKDVPPYAVVVGNPARIIRYTT